MSASNDVRAAIFETLPRGLQGLLSSPIYVNFADCPVPNTKDGAIIAQGILSANLNALFKSIFDQVSLAELMMYSGSSNPCHLGILLSSLSLGNSNYQMNVIPTVMPQYEDVDGVPTLTGATVTLTPQVDSGASAPERTEWTLEGIADKVVSTGLAAADIYLDWTQLNRSSMTSIAGKAISFYKDGVNKACDFTVDLPGSGGGGASGGW